MKSVTKVYNIIIILTVLLSIIVNKNILGDIYITCSKDNVVHFCSCKILHIDNKYLTIKI